MTQLNSRASVSIFQIVFYLPALVASVFLCIKHGFGRSAGWLFLLLVSAFRIAGGAAQLDTYTNHSTGVYEASAILSSFGLSTLLLACLGLLSRASESVNQNINSFLNSVHFRLVQILILVGLILSIVGNTSINLDTQNETINVPVETKAGIIILLACWVLTAIIALFILRNVSHVSLGERGLVWGVLVSLPFLLIRIIYSILTVFMNDKNFNLIFPRTVTLWTLSTIEEAFIVLVLLVIGFYTEKTEARQKPAPVLTQANVEAQGGDRQRLQKENGQHQYHNKEAAGMPSNASAPQASSKAPRQGIKWRGSIIMTIIGAFRGNSAR